MPNNENYNLPEAISSLRRHCGLSKDQFAQIVGVHSRTVSRWERGESQPRGGGVRQQIYALAKESEYEELEQLSEELFDTSPPDETSLGHLLTDGLGATGLGTMGIMGGAGALGLTAIISKLASDASDSKKNRPLANDKSKRRVVSNVTKEVASELDVSMTELAHALQDVLLAADTVGLSGHELLELCAEWSDEAPGEE